jgi:hypothetical protein
MVCTKSCGNKLWCFKNPKPKPALKLIRGVGINDANYPVAPIVGGKQLVCPIYQKWISMIERGYSTRLKEKYPTYEDCSVVDEWHSFMGFRSWMLTQDWEGKELDKDLLVEGNKVYGPDTCLFISHAVNCFLTERKASRGNLPIGVSLSCNGKQYIAGISSGVGGVKKHLGMYDTPEDAYLAWYNSKREAAIELAGKQSDPRVAAALLARFP